MIPLALLRRAAGTSYEWWAMSGMRAIQPME